MEYVLILLLCLPAWVEAMEIGHDREIDAFISSMVEKHGFERGRLEAVFEAVRHDDAVIRLIAPRPKETRKDWKSYRARFVNPLRINRGVEYWERNQAALEKAGRRFAVPPEIIVAIIGIETFYGRNTGKFRVMDALSTLAFDYPDAPNRQERMAFFRSELENALVLARNSGIDPLSLYGSYAGAIGLPQFMPGSILKYGVDFDGDGKIDLLNSAPDAIGSIAHFLAMHGWKSGAPLVYPASVRSDRWTSFSGGLSARYSLKKLEAAGIFPKNKTPGLNFGLVDLQNERLPPQYWLATVNFFAIAQYNRSYYYAMSVVELSRAVKKARAHLQ